MKKIISALGIALAAVSFTAQANDYDDSLQDFDQFFRGCALKQGGEDMDATEKLALNTIIDGMMESIIEEMRDDLTEANIDPDDLATCIDTLEKAGCAAMEADEPPAECDFLDE